MQEAPKDKPKRGRAAKSATSIQTAPAELHAKPKVPARHSRAAKSNGELTMESSMYNCANVLVSS